MQKRIGILMADRSNPFWTDMKIHYNRLAKKTGLKNETFWPMPAHDPDSQSDLLEEMIRTGFDAIIINPLNSHNLVKGIIHASSEKIPVLDVGAKTDHHLFEKMPDYYVPVPTVDFHEQGRLGAEYIISRLQAERSSKVVILKGRPDSKQSIGRTDGAVPAFENTPDIRILAKEHADFSRERASIISRSLIEKEEDIDAFFCVNDLMALGVADAIRDLRMIKRPLIAGVDLIDEVREAIKKGIINASVAFSRAEVAASVLSIAVDCMEGKMHPFVSPVQSRLVCRDNIDDFHD